MTSIQRWGWSVALLAAGMAAAGAHNLPVIEEFYFDEDMAAAPVTVVEGSDDAAVAALMKQRERGRKSVEATSQLARIAMAAGRTELGLQLHQQALAATTPGSLLGRSVRWNYAWDLFHHGDVEGALEQWKTVQQGGRGKQAWVPPTYALALWTQGKQAEAVRWYAAAVRTEPQRWGSADALPQLLPDWRSEDLAVLAQVQAAWQAAPPAWP